MIVVGANVAKSSNGLSLPDGGLAVIRDGKLLFAIAEERLAREKKVGGFEKALEFASAKYLGPKESIDEVVLSSCCDFMGRPSHAFPRDQSVSYCGHHRSHAIGSLAWSGFSRAIILVMDSGGDVLTEERGRAWWQLDREQHSIFVADNGLVELVDRHASGPGDIGFGELYRAMTYFLGWHGARYAGNTMAAGALGQVGVFEDLTFFSEDNGNFRFPTGNDPQKGAGVITDLLGSRGYDFVSPRSQHGPFHRLHFSIAAWIQRELDRYVTSVFARYCEKYGTQNVILSGGVAYNCVTAGRLEQCGKGFKVFVQPASGDAGQCVGNAVDGYLRRTGELISLSNSSVSLGGAYKFSRKNRITLADMSLSSRDDKNLKSITKRLVEGAVCVLYHGRSEYGPRALGFRSIIAHAANASMRVKLNQIKFRNFLMPVAPVVSKQLASRYFDDSDYTSFMAKNVRLKLEYSKILSACSQGDGWARLQTVDEAQNKVLAGILNALECGGFIPVLLNTSLNGPGEPIVESPKDLLSWCQKYEADCAWINGIFYELDHPKSATLRFEHSHYAETIDNQYDPSQLSSRLLTMFPHIQVEKRERFLLRSKYIDWVKEGRKTTTVRFRRRGVEYPISKTLPLYASNRFEGFEDGVTEHTGFIEVNRVTYKFFDDLNDADAIADGFANENELKGKLKEIYSEIDGTDIVMIYEIDSIA
jgi:carbamoyltransferase